jgi:septal ring factor EnvC (AmiA/AmiB activator)
MRTPIGWCRSQPQRLSPGGQYAPAKRLATAMSMAAHLGLLVWTILALAAPADLDQRLKDERQELKQLKGQIKDYQDRLKRTKRRERTVAQDLEDSDHLLQQKGRELQTYEGHLKAEAEKHAALVKDMQELTRQLQARQGFLQQRLRALYKQGRVAYLPFLLSASDVSDFLTRLRFTMKLVEYDADLVQQYRADLEALERTRRAAKAREEQLTKARLRVAAKKDEIERERWRKDQLLTKIRGQQETYESAMQELEQASARLLALITQLEQQRKRALAQRAREQRQRQARLPRPETPPPSVDHYADALDDQSRFARLRGQLLWPLAGKLVLTYGRVKHPTFNIDTFNKGIGISAPPGTEFRVIEAGQVLYANWFKGFGNLLIVDHGESYYSVYAYASELLVQVGDRVKRYQVVGKTGEGGSLHGPALYFEIRHHGKPENPLEWLADH